MVLVASPRHTAADLAAWATHVRTDEINAARWRDKLAAMADRAVEAIVAWAGGGRGYCGVSWGKDSVVVAHLVARAREEHGVNVPIVWVRLEHAENPDCPRVRDAFLSRWPVTYDEIVAPVGEHRMSEVGFRMARERHGDRHCSGVRAEESRVRRISMRHLGLDTGRACRPIGWWTADHVYAYLHAHELPVHPAYGCSLGGRLDRRWIRVAALGGDRGTEHGRAEWEQRYYPEVAAVWQVRDLG